MATRRKTQKEPQTTASAFLGLGAAFFPEHHPRETWPDYVNKISAAGLSFVRLAEFTWDKMEPREGDFDFAWLDKVFALLDAKKVRVILCTPTGVPPLWACEKYPEIFPVRDDGKVFGFGLRRYTCPTSTAYRALCERLDVALAEHYGRNPQVLAWQIDNEVGHPFCFCPRCLRHFQEWCRQRYGTIQRFNDALCTHFLGQTVTEFSQIPFPLTYPHPSLWLVYHQFFSAKTIDCFLRQVQTLKAHGVTAPVTTNLMPTWHGYDHEQMGAGLDVIAGDHYGLNSQAIFGSDFMNEHFTHSYLRGMKHGGNIWFHEFLWGRAPNLPLPGQVRWEVLTQIGLGVDLISFFRFDSCPSGMERDGYGLLDVHRQPGRIFNEIKDLTSDVARLKPHLNGSTPPCANVAFLFTHDNHCEFARNPKLDEFQGPAGNGYSMHLARHFQALARLNIRCDIAYPGDDLAANDVVIAPALYILPAALGARLDRYVAGGGTLVLTSLSGLADENARILDTPAPGPLAQACGIEVRDYGPYYAKAGAVTIVSAASALSFPPIGEVKWIDEILPRSKGVEVLGRFDNPFYQGTPAITRNPYKAGCAYYLGTILTQEGYNAFYAALRQTLRLRPVLELPEGLFATVRRKRGRDILFINNPDVRAREFELDAAYTNLLNGKPLHGKVTLPPFGVLVLASAGSALRA